MKTMTCKELGGACAVTFQAETFEEISKLSKQHGIEMFQKGDEAHLKVMQQMRALMHEPDAMENWMETKRKEFEALPED